MKTSLEQYLEKHLNSKSVYLVGPLLKKSSECFEPTLFIDGGAKWRKDKEGFSLGDGDSFEGELDLRLAKDKDLSDFAYALKHLEGFESIHALGFLGERLDHQMFNLGEASEFLKKQKRCCVLFDSKLKVFTPGSWKFSHKGIFSVWSLEPATFSICGDCQYPLRKKVISPLSSLTLSNEARGEIELSCDQVFFCYFNR